MRARFVVYAIVLALLGFVLAAKPFEPDELPPPSLTGTTAQGQEIRLELDARGRVQTFEVGVNLDCEVGSLAAVTWTPSGAPTRFASRGPRLSATSEGHFREAGRSAVAMRGTLRGTVGALHASGLIELTTARGPRGVCTSGRVRWSAG